MEDFEAKMTKRRGGGPDSRVALLPNPTLLF